MGSRPTEEAARIQRLVRSLWGNFDRLVEALPDDVDPGAERSAELRPLEDDDPEDSRESFLGERYIYTRAGVALSRKIREYVEARNLVKVDEYWSELRSNAVHLDDMIPDRLTEGIDDLLSTLRVLEPRLIYLRPQSASDIAVLRLVVPVNRELALRVSRDPRLLREISSRRFEELMAEIFASFGFHVELTAPVRDGGMDLIAVRSDHGILTRLIVECKRWLPPNKVGVIPVRQLYAVRQFAQATKALLVTTTHFTQEAREVEAQHLHELELKDYDAVVAWVQEYAKLVH